MVDRFINYTQVPDPTHGGDKRAVQCKQCGYIFKTFTRKTIYVHAETKHLGDVALKFQCNQPKNAANQKCDKDFAKKEHLCK